MSACVCGHYVHSHVGYTGSCGSCDCVYYQPTAKYDVNAGWTPITPDQEQ